MNHNTLQDILQDRKIAILTADGFDELQLSSANNALELAGAEVFIVTFKNGKIIFCKNKPNLKALEEDKYLGECTSDIFDGLVIPGGENYSDALIQNKTVSNFVKEFVYDGKSVATMCDGTKILLNSGVVRQRAITTWPALKSYALKSGAKWRDDEVVTDKGIVTSRCPKESPVFIRQMIECFSIGPKTRRL